MLSDNSCPIKFQNCPSPHRQKPSQIGMAESKVPKVQKLERSPGTFWWESTRKQLSSSQRSGTEGRLKIWNVLHNPP